MKILIALATWNRPRVTEICLENLKGFRQPNVRLVAYDDASDAYDAAWLETYADEVVRFPARGGIARSRARAVRDFVSRFTDYDVLYLTDNDTVHDPGFLNVLGGVFQAQAGNEATLPVSLYNTPLHASPDKVLGEVGGFYVTRTLAGVSQAYDRGTATTLAEVLDRDPELDHIDGWDFHYITALERPGLISKVSYLDHFARDRDEGGMHNPIVGQGAAARADFERDRAANPTPWLAGVREQVIDRILAPD